MGLGQLREETKAKEAMLAGVFERVEGAAIAQASAGVEKLQARLSLFACLLVCLSLRVIVCLFACSLARVCACVCLFAYLPPSPQVCVLAGSAALLQ